MVTTGHLISTAGTSDHPLTDMLSSSAVSSAVLQPNILAALSGPLSFVHTYNIDVF